MNAADLELALRIKGDVKSAHDALGQTRDDIKAVGQEASTASKSTDQYTASLSKQQRASIDAAKAAANQADALKLMASIDPVGNKLDKLDALEQELSRLHQVGTINQADFAALGDILSTQRGKLTEAAEGATQAAGGLNLMGFASGQAAREYGVLAGELARGNYTRLEGSIITLSNRVGLLPKLFSAGGVAVAGFIAVLATLAIAFVKGQEEDEKFNAAIESTNGFVGLTAGGMRQLAASMATGAVSIGQAKEALLEVADSGRFTGEQIGLVAKAAIDMSDVTGISVKQAVADFEQLGESPVDAAAKLDQQYHFLTTMIYEQIKALEDQGRSTDAAALAQATLAQRFDEAARNTEANMGTLQRVMQDVRTTASSMWDAILGIGRKTTDADKLGDVQDELIRLSQKGLVGYNAHASVNSYQLGNNFGAASPEEQRAVIDTLTLYKQLTGSVQAANAAASDKAAAEQAHTQAIQAEHDLDGKIKGYDKVADRANAVAKVTEELNQIVRGNGTLPAGIQELGQTFSGPGFDYLVDKEAGIHKKKGAGIDHAQLAADVAAVQNALKLIQDAYANNDKVLEAQHRAGQISDKAYYDGLRKDLDDYETAEVATLEKEKDAATSHIKTAADRIRADQKVAEIDTQITKVHDDASTKRQEIDAQEQQSITRSITEWENLRRSFQTPAEARVEEATQQIEKLNRILANGVIDSKQYHDALQQIGQHAIAALPTYSGVDAAVGGPYSELLKNFDAEKKLQEAYQADLLALKDNFRGTDEAHQEAYQSALANLDQQYAQRSLLIEQSRQQLLLTTTSNLFGQLATLSSSHNKKMATIGKAAAIAQAIINTYQSATEAYKALAGIPYIGPELGAAAAAIAIAAGLANVAQIRAQPIGGYAGGGEIRGPGTKTSDSIPIYASAGEFMQSAAAVDHYGVDFMHAVNDRSFPRMAFALGGPIGDVPSISAPSPRATQLSTQGASASNRNDQLPEVRPVIVFDADELADVILNTPTGVKLTIHHVGAHPRAIQGKWGS